jgi:hypothetical protein
MSSDRAAFGPPRAVELFCVAAIGFTSAGLALPP